ncbi:hypothetical protein [Terriglobus roseus]|uniref:hypothetical protein n=1 Tax=Terriglobus roseus TaxID=392734 RepID=UPI001BAE5E13|nr:hypothetical protein [Terriglobus roseus]
MLGLIAWATVFPAAVFLDHLRIEQRVHPEFWNIPKYFVAGLEGEAEIISRQHASKSESRKSV